MDPRPLNASLWGRWVADGAKRWDVAQRSWTVFARNTTELVDLLGAPMTNIATSMMLMGDDRQVAQPFWEELDQRLHNQLASAVSLVDHTRRLLKFYAGDAPEMVGQFTERNAAVSSTDEAVFLRDLRNYLVHYGVAPIVQSMRLGEVEDGTTGHAIKLAAEHVRDWDGWRAQSRRYLDEFGEREGPVLGLVVVDYANAMSGLYFWLWEQRQFVTGPANAPQRFRMDELPPEFGPSPQQ